MCIAEEVPFELPKGWAWARFSTTALSMNTGPFGSALHKTDYVQKGVPVINPADIHDGVVVAGKMVSPMTRDRLNSYVLRKGDLIIARRGEMGRAAFIGRSQDGWLCGTGCFFAHMPREMNGSLLKLLFSSLIIRKQLEESSVGTTLKNLNLTEASVVCVTRG